VFADKSISVSQCDAVKSKVETPSWILGWTLNLSDQTSSASSKNARRGGRTPTHVVDQQKRYIRNERRYIKGQAWSVILCTALIDSFVDISGKH